MPDRGSAYDGADIEFDAEGAALRGWVYRPQLAASDVPVVVMAHGYNCLKEFYLDKYAAEIANAGHVVLAYDHRNFGASDGEPRQELDPWVQVRDYRGTGALIHRCLICYGGWIKYPELLKIVAHSGIFGRLKRWLG